MEEIKQKTVLNKSYKIRDKYFAPIRLFRGKETKQRSFKSLRQSFKEPYLRLLRYCNKISLLSLFCIRNFLLISIQTISDRLLILCSL
jgi:hypothetical protein